MAGRRDPVAHRPECHGFDCAGPRRATVGLGGAGRTHARQPDHHLQLPRAAGDGRGQRPAPRAAAAARAEPRGSAAAVGRETEQEQIPMIYADALTKTFGEPPRAITAVDRLSLEVAEGEVFGFLGPNGAGKTTTVRMLTCLIAPSSGTATIGGLAVGRDSQAIRAKVGLLTETPG